MAKLTERGREMRRVLEQWKRSGLSLAEFGRRRGIPQPTLGWWRHRLRRVEIEEQPEFVEVTVATVTEGRAAFEIVLVNGVMVRVGERFESEALAQVLRAVSEAC